MAFITGNRDPKNRKNGEWDVTVQATNDDCIEMDNNKGISNNTCMKPMIKKKVNLPPNIDNITADLTGLISSFLPKNDQLNFQICSSTINGNINALYLHRCHWVAKISHGNVVIKYLSHKHDMRKLGFINTETMTISKHFGDNENYNTITDYIKRNDDGVWLLIKYFPAKNCGYNVSCVKRDPINNEMIMLDPGNNAKLNTKELDIMISMLRHPLVRFISSVNLEREYLRIRSIKFDCCVLSRNIGVRPAVHQNIIYYGNKTQTRIGIKISEICYVCFKSIKGANWKAVNKYNRAINLPNKIVNKIEGFYILTSGQIPDLLLSPEKISVHYNTKQIALINQKDTILMMTRGKRKDFIFLQRLNRNIK